MQIWPSVFLFFFYAWIPGDYRRVKVILIGMRIVLPTSHSKSAVHFCAFFIYNRYSWDTHCHSCRRRTLPSEVGNALCDSSTGEHESLMRVLVVPESSESLLSRVPSMSSSDISISSSRLMPISCSLCKFLISCKTHPKDGIRSTETGECMNYQVLVEERVHYQCQPLRDA